MMKALSIRLRLTLWYSAVLLAGLILFGYSAWFALRLRLVAELDGSMARQADGLRETLEAEGIAADGAQIREELRELVGQMPAGSVLKLRSGSGDILAPSPDAWPVHLTGSTRPAYSSAEQNGRKFRTLTKRIYASGKPFTLFIAIPSQPVEEVLRAFRAILWALTPGVLVIAGLGAWWVSRRALSPVDDIAKVARSITLQNLSRRLVVPQTGDELQRMSETWNDVLARLETAVGRIRQFTADASHELRTPVALIRTTAELALRRDRDSETYRRSLREILSESERMTKLTNDLLFLAAADAVPLDMPLTPADLNGLILDAVETSVPLAEARRIHLKTEIGPGHDPVAANEDGIKRLLRILLDNALKFTPPEGTVVVSTARDRTGITIAVKDSGPGIPAEAIPHIFERFYRADPSHKHDGGAGLGLSIAQMIAAAHGASIRVESAPGAGSCFSIHLKG